MGRHNALASSTGPRGSGERLTTPFDPPPHCHGPAGFPVPLSGAAIRHAKGVASAGFTRRGGAPFHRHTWRGAVLCHQPGRIGSCTSHRDALDSWLAPFARRGAHSGRNAQSESSRPMPFALANTWPYSADPGLHYLAQGSSRTPTRLAQRPPPRRAANTRIRMISPRLDSGILVAAAP